MAKTSLVKTEQQIAEDQIKVRQQYEKAAAILHRAKADDKKLKDRLRKIRTRKLIIRGGLVDIAGLLDINPQVLTGALLSIKDTILNAETETMDAWRRTGAELLNVSKAERKPIRDSNGQKINECKLLHDILAVPEHLVDFDVTD